MHDQVPIRHLTEDGSVRVQVLVATGDHVLIVDADSAQAHAHGQGPLLALAVAPNGSFVASFSESGRLMVWTADFTKVLSEFETDVTGPPKALAWCGTGLFVAWTIVASAILVMGSIGAGNFRAQAERDRRIYEERLSAISADRDIRLAAELRAKRGCSLEMNHDE